MLPRAEQIIALYDEMRAVGTSASEMVGKVTIGSVVSAMGLLAAVVAGLKSTHPQLAVRLITARSLDLAAQVGSGEIDAAVLVESTGKVPANMRWTPLYAEPLVLAASKMTGDASAGKLLRARPFLQFDRTQRTGVLIDRALRKNKLEANHFLELSSLEAIIELVRQDIGVAIVPMVRRSMWRSDAALRICRYHRRHRNGLSACSSVGNMTVYRLSLLFGSSFKNARLSHDRWVEASMRISRHRGQQFCLKASHRRSIALRPCQSRCASFVAKCVVAIMR